MINRHTVDYHPSLSQLTSKIHPFLFLWTRNGFISPEYFLIFFSNLYIPPWLQKSFKFMVLRLLANTFVNQRVESVHFYSCPEQNSPPCSYHYPKGSTKFPIPPELRFLKVYFFPNEKKDMELKRWPKLKLREYWINSTIVATFHFWFLFYCTII